MEFTLKLDYVYIFIYIACMLSCFSCDQVFATLWALTTRLLSWDSPGKKYIHTYIYMCVCVCVCVCVIFIYMGFSGSSGVKNPHDNAGDSSSIPRLGRSPREGHGNPLQYLAWRTPWIEEPGGLQSIGSQRVRHNWATNTFSLTNRWHSKNSLEKYLGLFVKFYHLMFIYPFPLIHLSISNVQTKSKNNLRYRTVTQQN